MESIVARLDKVDAMLDIMRENINRMMIMKHTFPPKWQKSGNVFTCKKTVGWWLHIDSTLKNLAVNQKPLVLKLSVGKSTKTLGVQRIALVTPHHLDIGDVNKVINEDVNLKKIIPNIVRIKNLILLQMPHFKDEVYD